MANQIVCDICNKPVLSSNLRVSLTVRGETWAHSLDLCMDCVNSKPLVFAYKRAKKLHEDMYNNDVH